MGRVLCIDYGTRRIGLAVSDETQTIAQGLPTIDCRLPNADCRMKEVATRIAAIVREREVESVILGHPISLSGKPSTRSRRVLEFKHALEKALTVPLMLVDERFTTVLARQYLGEAYRRVRAQKHPVDKVAAVVLLEDYLARVKGRGSWGEA